MHTHTEPNNSNRNLISAAVWTPKGMLLSGGADGCVRTWDMAIGGNPLVQCLPVTCDVSGAGPTGAIGMVDRSQGVADGGSIWSISILERIVDERGYATALDETMVCCGTATGKTFVMALTADE